MLDLEDGGIVKQIDQMKKFQSLDAEAAWTDESLDVSADVLEDDNILEPDMPVESWSEPNLGHEISGEGEEILEPLIPASEEMLVEPAPLLDLVMKLGILLLQNGAETYRVEDSVSRVLRAYRANEPSTFAVPSLVAISFKDNDGTVHTKTQRVSTSAANLDRVYRLNTLSRYLTANCPELDYFADALEEVKSSYVYKDWMIIVGSGALAAGFNLMLGGVLTDVWAPFLIGLLTRWAYRSLTKMALNSVFSNIIGSAVATVLAELLGAIGLVQNTGVVTIAVLMNLVPGALLTNAIRDIIATDYMSGITKLTEALMVAASLAIGAGVGYGVGTWIGGF